MKSIGILHRELEDMTERIENKSGSYGGSNLWILIFLVVLLLHFIFILGFMGFNLLNNRNKETSKTQSISNVQEQKPPREEHPVNPASEENPFLEPGLAAQPEKKNPIGTDGVDDKKDLPLMDDKGLAVSQGPSSESTSASETLAVDQPPAETLPPPVKTAAPAESSGNFYIVVEGDTLSKIAAKTGVSIDDIRKKNRIDKDVVKLGQKLIIPEKSNVKPFSASNPQSSLKQPGNAPVTSPKPPATSGNYKTYRVEKGDTLNKIAALSHTSPENLAKINNIGDPRKLKVGTEIKVPKE